MKRILAVAVAIAVLLAYLPNSTQAKDDGGYAVMYDCGSLPVLKAGKKLRLYIDSKEIRIMDDKAVVATLVPGTIQEISYGQDVHRRIGAAIGLAVVLSCWESWVDGSDEIKEALRWPHGGGWRCKGGFAMQADKNDYRGVIAGLEGVTGKKAVNSDAMTVKNEPTSQACSRRGSDRVAPTHQESSNIGISGDLSTLLRIFGGRVAALLKTFFQTVEFSFKVIELGPVGLQLLLRS